MIQPSSTAVPTSRPPVTNMMMMNTATLSPTMAPSVYNDEEDDDDDYMLDENDGAYDDHDDYYDDNFRFGNACRCNQDSLCVSTPLPYGVNFTLCVFTPDAFEFDGVSSLFVVQGENEWNLLTETTPLPYSCNEIACVLELSPLDDSLYESTNETSATIVGVAELLHSVSLRRLALRAEMDFTAELTLETSAAAAGIDQDDTDQAETPIPRESTGNGSTLIAWLFPVLAVLVVALICVVVVIRKRSEHQRTLHI